MTYEEALNIIGDFLPDTKIDTIDKLDAMMYAMLALEKQMPNKVKNIRCFEKIDIYKYGYCPKCGCGCNYEMRFCYGCGQAIDWSEE